MGGASSSKSKGPADPLKVAEDHFIKGRQVGEGGFGKVFAMSHYKTGQWYAMKDLSKLTVKKSNNIKMIFNERNLLAEVPVSPFIINMHYAFQDAESCFILMDLAMGGDLRFHWKKGGGKMEESRAKFYILCIALALEFLHENRIVHRDIKPENVVISTNGYCQLTDFGISKKLNDDNHVEGTSGTRAYMAPEVFKDLSHHDGKADCWSLGVLTYELVAGNNAVLTGSEMSRAGPAKNTAKKLTGPVKDFCARCLQMNPADRASLAELVNDSWFLDSYELEKFRRLDYEAPWKPEQNKTYFVQNQNEMENAIEGFDMPAPKKVGPNTDPAFNGYEFNLTVSADEAASPPKKEM